MSEEPKGFFAQIPFPARLAFAGCLLIGLATMFLSTINNGLKVSFYAGVGVTGIMVGAILLFWALIWVMEQS